MVQTKQFNINRPTTCKIFIQNKCSIIVSVLFTQTIIFSPYEIRLSSKSNTQPQLQPNPIRIPKITYLLQQSFDQHPLTLTWSISAMKQMQGQQSAFMALKYFKHWRSAIMSDPPASMAFWQAGYPALMSSMQTICLLSGQVQSLRARVRPSRQRTKMMAFIVGLGDNYYQSPISSTHLQCYYGNDRLIKG